MLSELMFRGGSIAQTVQGGDTVRLSETTRWLYIIGTGTPGTAKLQLPFARGLPNGLVWHFMAGTNQSGVDFQFTTADGSAIEHYPKDGSTAQTLIDSSDSVKWGSRPALRIVLLSDTAAGGQGTWRSWFWGAD